MAISWNPLLVALSVLIAILGSFSALSHAERMREVLFKSDGQPSRGGRLWWLAGGITLGMTVWAMHFIGMLAAHLPIPIAYDSTRTLLSMMPAMAAALLGFSLLRRPRDGSSKTSPNSATM